MEDIIWIKSAPCEAFEMTGLGELKVFLGREIRRNRTFLQLTIHQRRYIDRILSHHGMSDTCPNLTPLDLNTRLVAHKLLGTTAGEITDASVQVYQSAVGSLMYVILGTQPNIAYAVGQVSAIQPRTRLRPLGCS